MTLIPKKFHNDTIDCSFTCYIQITENNKEIPWFKGIEIARALGYKNAKNAILRHVEQDDKINMQYCNVLRRVQTVPNRASKSDADTSKMTLKQF